jgi:Flp pilus assembly protein TadD
MRTNFPTFIRTAGSAALALWALSALGCATAPKPPPEPIAPLVVAAPEPPPPPPEPTVAERLGAAKSAFASRNWSAVHDEASAALSKDAGNLSALQLQAVSYDLEGRFDEAIAAYKAVLAVDPKHEPSLLNLGMIYRRREKFDDAIALYSSAVEAQPDNVKLRNNLGVVYRLAKRYDESEKTLRRVLARSPGDVDAYKNMVVLFLDQNKLSLAEQFSVEAKKLLEAAGKGDGDAGLWNNLGLIHYRKDEGKPTRALAAFRKAAELDPNDAASRINIGAVAMRYRDYATAETNLSKAVALEPNNPEATLAYAFALDGLHKVKEAREQYAKAQSLFGTERCDVAWQLAMLGKYEKNWRETFDRLTGYRSLSCTDQPEAKVAAELKTAEYYVKQPQKAAEPAPAPKPAPAPVAAPAPADDVPAAPQLPGMVEGESKPEVTTPPPTEPAQPVETAPVPAPAAQ